MIKYPKIESLYKRDDKFKFTKERRITDIDNVKNIVITEKIDGTNAQIVLSIDYNTLAVKVRFCSKETEILQKDVMFIANTCTKKLNIKKISEWYYNEFALDQQLGRVKENVVEVRLFGEVYGAGINKGGTYSKEKDFRLFDIQIGEHFVDYSTLIEIAEKLGIKTVPLIYNGLQEDLLEYENIKDYVCRLTTKIIDEGGTGGLVEGIVIRPEPLLLNRFGGRIIIKVKLNDFTYEEIKEKQLTIDEVNPEDIDRREGLYNEKY